jgi:hypothetical protein
MKASIFVPSSALIENADHDFNEFPDGHQRRGNPFWQFMGSMLGLPPPTGGTISNHVVVIPDRNDDDDIAIAAMRRLRPLSPQRMHRLASRWVSW